MTTLAILFIAGLFALGWQWHTQAAVQHEETELRSPNPGLTDGAPRPDRGMPRHTEHAFLKLLIAQDDSEASRQLQIRLTQAERETKSIHRAVGLMVVLFMLSLGGLAYCAILEPDVFSNHRHWVIRNFCYLGLGSLIAQVVFLGYFLWHRAIVSHLRREGRRLVLALAQSKLVAPAAPSISNHVEMRSPNSFLGTSPQPIRMTSRESFDPSVLRSQS